MTLKILCKLSTETKRYSSHTILQNSTYRRSNGPCSSTAILWRRPSNVLLSWTPLVRRPNVVTARRPVLDNQRSWPSCRWQLDTTLSRGIWSQSSSDEPTQQPLLS